MGKAFLITGRPGVGKTTLLKRIVEKLPLKVGGFYTEEIREGGKRVGFKITTLDGEEGLLSRVGFPSPFKVGRYGVDLQSFERIGVEALRRALKECDLLVVDEIGKMELSSETFRAVLEEALKRGKSLLGTILEKPHPWIDQFKARPGVFLFRLTERNREEIERELLDQLLKSR
ncbi:MAG: NTPase [Candidatus Methylomirabilales bacterium]